MRSQLEPIIKTIIDKFRKAKSVVNDLPHETIKELAILLNETNNFIIDLGNQNEDQYVSNRFEMSTAFMEKRNKLLTIWEKVAGLYLESTMKNWEQTENELKALKEKSAADADQIQILRRDLEAQLKSFDERYKEIYSKAELGKQERRFMRTADYSNNQAKFWMWVIAGLAITLIILCIIFISACWIELSCVFKNTVVEKEQQKWLLVYEIIRKSFLRLLILSLIIYLIKFSVKNYNALKHNFVINRHKEDSLDAVLNLMYNLPEGVGRDEVINTASREIFTQHKTGFLQKEDDLISISLLDKILSFASIKGKGKE